jgi:hypothetical protein
MKYSLTNIFCIGILTFWSCNISSSGIEIERNDEKFELYIDGVHTYIKGVGGNHRLELASQHGANAFRTWGGTVESIRKDLEQARANNLYIMQGIALTKKSALYFDNAYKDKVRNEVRVLAETFKDEPHIMAWGIGNEIDLGEANIGAAWTFVNELAQLIKSIDNRHLVSSVIAHHPAALDSIAKFAPALDFVGINSYGSIMALDKMLEKSAYQGPFMVTEWGPSGFWEMPSTEWKAPIEQTSEEKRIVYEERYNKYILSNPRCLGSFVFLWGQKEERTPTWFSMFVENNVEGLLLKGKKTPMVEAMQRVWTNKEPLETAPVVQSLHMNGKAAIENVYVKQGAQFEAEVIAFDKEEHVLTYVWEILKEATILGFGGSYEPRPERVGEVSMTNVNRYVNSVKEPGSYRLFVYVLDNTGFASTANIPFHVK